MEHLVGGILAEECKNCVVICLWGFASERQLEYEEKVLLDVVADNNGSAREAPGLDATLNQRESGLLADLGNNVWSVTLRVPFSSRPLLKSGKS